MPARIRTIGRLAEEAGVGVETIRFYERRGLLKQPRRPADGGFRQYEDDAVRRLRYIRIGRGFGLSLGEIERLLVPTPIAAPAFCQAVRDTVTAKLTAVQTQIADLRALEATLQRFLTDCGARDPALPCPVLVGLGVTPQADGSVQPGAGR